MKIKVIALPEVDKYLQDLITILYQKEYFAFEESAQKYVDDLYDDIETNLPTRLHKPAPSYFDKYGKNMEYVVFKKNKRTQWYVFFRVYRERGELIYQVRYIANNHTVAQFVNLQ